MKQSESGLKDSHPVQNQNFLLEKYLIKLVFEHYYL